MDLPLSYTRYFVCVCVCVCEIQTLGSWAFEKKAAENILTLQRGSKPRINKITY